MRILRRLSFNLWYFRKPPWDTGISPPELIHFIKTHKPGRALDIGCGTGINVITLAKNGWQVSGIDYAWPAIHKARQKVREVGVQADLRVADVTEAGELSGPFDLILDIGCFHSLGRDERHKYIANIERWLSPQGSYLVYLFTKDEQVHEGPGVSAEDLQELSNRFRLIERQDGTERGRRPSAWLMLQHVN